MIVRSIVEQSCSAVVTAGNISAVGNGQLSSSVTRSMRMVPKAVVMVSLVLRTAWWWR